MEGIEIPEERIALIQETAHKAGLSKKQYDSIVSAVAEADAAALSEMNKSVEEDKVALKQEWGMAFDERKNDVLKAAEYTGAPDRLIEAIKNDDAGSDTMKWLHKVHEFIKGEGVNMNNDHGDNNNSKVTPAEAKAQISEIMNNKNHPYFNPGDPGHKDALQKMIDLQKMAAVS
jgi:hypothetical protein